MARIPINDDDPQPEANDAAEQSPAGGDELAAMKKERDDLFERLARTTADFKNSMKRLEAESDQRAQYANSSLIKSLLPVIDNFERALAVDPAKTDIPAILKGMQIVHDQWMKVLKQQRVDEIAPEAGEPFDPKQHEALMQQPSDKYNEPTVTQLLQKGYSHQGRVLRPAQVAVSKIEG